VNDDRSVLDRPAAEPDDVLVYGPGPDQVVDVYVGSATHSFVGPLVVFFHGGFWRQEYDRRHVRPLAHSLARAGCTVALVEYRRVAGGGGWPATFDDVRLALREVVAARTDAPAVVLGGHSAGGHLALWVAAQPDVPTLARVVALAPVADLLECDARHLGDDAARALLGGPPAQHRRRWGAADPALLPTPAAPVTLIHARDDSLVPITLSRRYADVHRATTVIEVDGGHFAVIDPDSRAWPTVRRAMLVP